MRKLLVTILLGMICVCNSCLCFGADYFPEMTELPEETREHLTGMEKVIRSAIYQEYSSGDYQVYDHSVTNQDLFEKEFWDAALVYAVIWNPWVERDGYENNPHLLQQSGVTERVILSEQELMDFGHALFSDFEQIPEVPYDENLAAESQYVIRDNDNYLFSPGEWLDIETWTESVEVLEDNALRLVVRNGLQGSENMPEHINSTYFVDLVPNSNVNPESDFPYYYSIKQVVFVKGAAEAIPEDAVPAS